jgi:hypothetical protein
MLSAPSFRFEDFRTGRVESVTRVGSRFQLKLRPERDEPLEVESMTLRGRVIVDEGYRMLLRGAWEHLERGRSIVSEAIVPSRLASYGMRFRGLGRVPRSGQPRLHVRLDMNDFLLRLVGPSADLYFDPRSRQLVEFVGLANIRDESGDLQQARIVYRHAT